jgi:hypothetical protein
LGPYKVEYTCLDGSKKVNKIISDENFGFTPKSVEKFLTIENILKEQLKDEKLKKVHDTINRGEKSVGRYFLDKNLLFKSSNNEYRPDCIVVPRSLVPYVLASYHFMSHAGAEKMLNLIQLKYLGKHGC